MQPQLWTLFKHHIPYLVKALAAALEVWMAINLMMLLVAYFWYTECVSTKRIADHCHWFFVTRLPFYFDNAYMDLMESRKYNCVHPIFDFISTSLLHNCSKHHILREHVKYSLDT